MKAELVERLEEYLTNKQAAGAGAPVALAPPAAAPSAPAPVSAPPPTPAAPKPAPVQAAAPSTTAAASPAPTPAAPAPAAATQGVVSVGASAQDDLLAKKQKRSIYMIFSVPAWQGMELLSFSNISLYVYILYYRAERFGIEVNVTEADKKRQRGERFGGETESSGAAGNAQTEEDKKQEKARGDRFGTPAASSPALGSKPAGKVCFPLSPFIPLSFSHCIFLLCYSVYV